MTSPDPEAMAAFYTNALGYTFTSAKGTLLGIGPDRRFRFRSGPKNEIGYAAFAVDGAADLAGLRLRLDAAAVAYETHGDASLFTDSVAFHDPDGQPFIFGILAEDVSTGAGPLPASPARLQHFVTASTNPDAIIGFFIDTVGFALSDIVLDEERGTRTAFLRCSPEHHSFAVFLAPTNRLDHHCYETRDWNSIRDWADHFATLDVPLFWGPGRHGPGNNLFIFIHDPDGNSVELSVELEVIASSGRQFGEWAHANKTANYWGHALLRS